MKGAKNIYRQKWRYVPLPGSQPLCSIGTAQASWRARLPPEPAIRAAFELCQRHGSSYKQVKNRFEAQEHEHECNDIQQSAWGRVLRAYVVLPLGNHAQREKNGMETRGSAGVEKESHEASHEDASAADAGMLSGWRQNAARVVRRSREVFAPRRYPRPRFTQPKCYTLVAPWRELMELETLPRQCSCPCLVPVYGVACEAVPL